MDREYLVNQLMNIAKQNGVEIDAEVLGMIVNKAIFRVASKGSILQNVFYKTAILPKQTNHMLLFYKAFSLHLSLCYN